MRNCYWYILAIDTLSEKILLELPTIEPTLNCGKNPFTNQENTKLLLILNGQDNL